MYGEQYSGFENYIQLSGPTKPTDRFEEITRHFAAKSAQYSKFSKWFQCLPDTNIFTRSKKQKSHKHTQKQKDTRGHPYHI